ncbi:MAG: hypothetical protein Q9159_004017 [Coniocarpon cinnabarinum]
MFTGAPILTLALLGLAAASPLSKRQSGTQRCGSDSYSASKIASAANTACSYISQGGEAGGSKYPERYNDYEGFSFDGAPGPYYEFPILESGTYDGGSPGADRVVVSTSGGCGYVGLITHSGASDNDFVACSGTD